MSEILEAVGLSVSIPDGPELTYPDFSIRTGARVALSGASGSGKTTLLRLIAGLQNPDHGDVVVSLATIGYAFQSPRLIPQISALKNLTLVDGIDEITARNAMIEMGLREKTEQKCATLSGGEAARVNILRAVLGRPTLLLLDEVVAGLDNHSLAQVKAFCDKIWRSYDLAIIEIAHAPELRLATSLESDCIELCP